MSLIWLLRTQSRSRSKQADDEHTSKPSSWTTCLILSHHSLQGALSAFLRPLPSVKACGEPAAPRAHIRRQLAERACGARTRFATLANDQVGTCRSPALHRTLRQQAPAVTCAGLSTAAASLTLM
jgi:hypothetical protein